MNKYYPVRFKVTTDVEILPLPDDLVPGPGDTCAVCTSDATHEVAPTVPNGMALPVYYLCVEHGRELLKGE